MPGKWFRKRIREIDTDVTVHDLRRTCVSRAVELTQDISSAKHYLGHADTNTTFKYLDAGESGDKRVAQAMDKVMQGLLAKAGRLQKTENRQC